MSRELKNLSLKEKWDNFLDFVDAPTKARLLDCDYKEGLEQYRYLRTEIEDAIKRIDMSKNSDPIEQVIEEIELAYGWEGIREEVLEIMHPIIEKLEVLKILGFALDIGEGIGDELHFDIILTNRDKEKFDKVKQWWLNRSKY